MPERVRRLRLKPDSLLRRMQAYDPAWWPRTLAAAVSIVHSRSGLPAAALAAVASDLHPERVLAATYKHAYGASTLAWTNSTPLTIEERAVDQAVAAIIRRLVPPKMRQDTNGTS